MWSVRRCAPCALPALLLVLVLPVLWRAAPAPAPAPRYVVATAPGPSFATTDGTTWFYSAYLEGAAEEETVVTVLSLSSATLHAADWGCALLLADGLERPGTVTTVHPALYAATFWKVQCRAGRKVQERVEGVRLQGTAGSLDVALGQAGHSRHEMGACVAGVMWSSGGSEGPSNLISFMEFYHLLGVERIILYALPQAREVALILDYYIGLGRLEVVAWTFPPALLASWSLVYFGQNLLLHDCLYRSRGRFTYLAYTDLDERLLPRAGTSLPALLRSIDSANTSSFGFRNNFYLDTWRASSQRLRQLHPGRSRLPDIREATFLTRQSMTGRTRHDWPYQTRSRYVVKPDLVEDLDIHYVIKSREGLATRVLEREVAELAHFRVLNQDSGLLEGEEGEEDVWLVERLMPAVVARVEAACGEIAARDATFHCDYILLNSTEGSVAATGS